MLTATISGPFGDALGFDWCSTQTTAPGCSAPSGICLPTTGDMLDAVKMLQDALNASRAARGAKLLCVDGRVGPATRQAVVDELTRIGLNANGYNFCDNVMSNVVELNETLVGRLISEGIPWVPPPACATPPSTKLPGGGVYNPKLPSSNLWKWGVGAGVAVAAIIGFTLVSSKRDR